MPFTTGIIGTILADILILLFAPVENENRVLELDERILFRKQAIRLLALTNVAVSVILLIHKLLFIAYWLETGVIFTGMLLALGVKRAKTNHTNKQGGIYYES